MRRLVGARVIFFMRQVTAFFLFGCPSPIGQNKKVQFTTNQCYITNKSSFLPITEQNCQIEDEKIANLVFHYQYSIPQGRLIIRP